MKIYEKTNNCPVSQHFWVNKINIQKMFKENVGPRDIMLKSKNNYIVS